MFAETPQILVVEDEEPIRRFLRATLASNGFDLVESETGRGALARAEVRPPDVMLLDLGLPDINGLEVLQRFRAQSTAPVIILSALGREADKVSAFDHGADDYLTKPFGVRELMARIRAVLRRSGGENKGLEKRFACGELTIDFAARRVALGDEPVHLTPIEYRLLTLLAHHAGKVLTHRALIEEVWDAGTAEVNHLRVAMAGLRRKLEANPAQPRYVITEQGIGYRLADD